MSFKPWTKDGFTCTTWLRLNSNLESINHRNGEHQEPALSQAVTEMNTIENEKSGFCSQQCQCKNKQHLISIGTSSMVLSIFLCVTNVNTMYFQLTNLNTQHQKSISKSHSEHFRCLDTALANGTKKSKCTNCTPARKRRNTKRDLNLHHETRRRPRSKENANKESPDEQSSASNVLSATINTTRNALKSSLSHFNLFSSNRNGEKDTDANSIGAPVEMRGIKLYKNRWTLFSLAACYVGNEVHLQIVVDNSPSVLLKLPCANQPADTRKDKINVLCIGHRYVQPSPPTKIKDFLPMEPTSAAIIQTEAESHTFRYSLSNVLLFRKRALNREILANLYALGPDCINFAQCQIGNPIPNIGVAATSKVQAVIPTNEVLRTLREHLMVVYSAHRPNSAIGYSNIDGKSIDTLKNPIKLSYL